MEDSTIILWCIGYLYVLGKVAAMAYKEENIFVKCIGWSVHIITLIVIWPFYIGYRHEVSNNER